MLITFLFWTAVICGALSLMCWIADRETDNGKR